MMISPSSVEVRESHFLKGCLITGNYHYLSCTWCKKGVIKTNLILHSLPIQMRATILYLANLCMDFKMLFTTNIIFSYLAKVLLLTCVLISQFIAHFWSICPFLFSASFTIPIIHKELVQVIYCYSEFQLSYLQTIFKLM